MRKTWLASVALMMAMSSAVAVADDAPQYCVASGMASTLKDQQGLMADIESSCKAGDIVIINSKFTAALAIYCRDDRAITVLGRDVMCTLREKPLASRR